MLSEGRPTDLIQSVSRAFRILEEVGDTPGGLHAKEIAHRCGIALPTTYHLLRTLCYEGYVVRRSDGRYALGLKIARRFRHLVASMERPPNVHEVSRHLSEVTGSGSGHPEASDPGRSTPPEGLSRPGSRLPSPLLASTVRASAPSPPQPG